MALSSGPGDEFAVQRDGPADAKLSRNYDRIYSPDVMTPLDFDPFLCGFGEGTPLRHRTRLVNYFFFGSRRPVQRSFIPVDRRTQPLLSGAKHQLGRESNDTSTGT